MFKFYNKDQYAGYNIYSMKKYVDKKRITLIIVLSIFIVATTVLSILYIINTKSILKKSQIFASQIEQYKSNLNSQEEEKKLQVPELTQDGIENMKNIYKSDKKRVFLTFDDGPSNNTKKILEVLRQYNIKATFFVLGKQVEEFPETTNLIYEEGHYIANHGYSHKYSSIYKSPEQVLIEYNQCNDAVAKTLNIPNYNSHLFRFPGGSVGGRYNDIKTQAKSILEQNNIAYVDWNCLTGDAEINNPSEEYLMNKVQNTSKEKNSIVVLMHDAEVKQITVDTLPKVIEYLKQQEYEFDNFYSIIK